MCSTQLWMNFKYEYPTNAYARELSPRIAHSHCFGSEPKSNPNASSLVLLPGLSSLNLLEFRKSIDRLNINLSTLVTILHHIPHCTPLHPIHVNSTQCHNVQRQTVHHSPTAEVLRPLECLVLRETNTFVLVSSCSGEGRCDRKAICTNSGCSIFVWLLISPSTQTAQLSMKFDLENPLDVENADIVCCISRGQRGW